MQDHSTARHKNSKVAVLLTLLGICSMLFAAFATPAFVQASSEQTVNQDVEPDRKCHDASGAELPQERCPDPCDDDLAAANGGHDDCDLDCEAAVAAAWGGPGHGDDDDDCPLPCPTLPPTPTMTPTATNTPPVAPTTTVEPTQTPTATDTPPVAPTTTVTPTATNTPPVAPTTTVTPTATNTPPLAPTTTVTPTATNTPPVAPTTTLTPTVTNTPPPAPTTDAAVAANGGNGHGEDKHGDDVVFDCETDDAHGRINSLPTQGGAGTLTRDQLNGEWVIDGRTFIVTEDTLLITRYGRFHVGKCVEVTWAESDPTFALMIESKPDRKCGNPGNAQSIIWGAVSGIPDDPNQLGEWVVGGITILVTPDTHIVISPWKEGPIEVGDFVKVMFKEEGDVPVAASVHGIWPFGSGHGWWTWRMGRAFGPIDALPAGGGVGTWEIAGVQYIVTDKTRLDDDEGAFAVGANVKVEFFKMPDGTRIARKIETTHDTGGGEAGVFRFVGVVDAKPDAFVGDWTIGGAPFVADANTTFNESNGLLVEGAYVAVRYSIVDDVRLASEIKTVIPPGGGGNKHFGRIERSGKSTMSAAGADGVSENVWNIGGQEFVVTEGTLLDDELSALEAGQFAFVDAYVGTDGTLVATSIEGMSQLFLPMLQNQ